MSDDTTELSREELLRRYKSKPAKTAADAKRRSPFKFLDSYDIDDADIFFGRDSEIEELLRHFHGYGHVLIYGESGCGKSSLVQCGLRSRIPEIDAMFIPLRVHAAGLSMVSHQICESASRSLGEAIEVSPDSSLADSLPEIRAAASRPLVLFFDQFEELFIFHDADTRRRFAEELAAIQSARLNVKVIIGIRQDYLAHLTELEDTVEGVFDNRFWLRRMSRENAAQAVVKACGTCDVAIEEDLTESILQRLDPGSQGVELPYLQVVMDRLFRQAVDSHPDQPVISAEDVEKLGDIADILGTFLVEEVAKLPSPDTGRQILKAFVTREGTRRSLDRDAVAREAASFGEAIPRDVVDTHLDQLANVRILRETTDSETHELRHDALAATVVGWISELEKELIEVRDNLLNRFNEYEARDRPDAALLDAGFMDYVAVYERRLTPLLDEPLRHYLDVSRRHLSQRRRKKQFSIGVGALAVALLVVGGLLFYAAAVTKEKNRALAAEVKAEDRKKEAEANLAKAREAVDTYFTTVSEDTLLNQPNTQELRKQLLADARIFYEDFADRHAGDSEVQVGVATAYFNLGRIGAEVDEDHEGALEHYEKARAIQQELLSQDDQDSKLRYALGNTWNAIGNAHDNLDNDKDALTAYEKAREVRQQLVSDDSANSEYQRRLANTIMNMGLVNQETGFEDEARRLINDAQQIRLKEVEKLETQGASSPSGTEHGKEVLFQMQRDLAMGLYNLGDLEEDSGNLDAAKSAYNQAVILFKQCLRETDNKWGKPNDLEVQYMLGESYRRWGDVVYDEIWDKNSDPTKETFVGDPTLLEEPESHYVEARERLVVLAKGNPAVNKYQAAVGRLYLHFGGLYMDWPGASEAGKLAKAAEFLAQAKKQLEPFKDENASYMEDWEMADSDLQAAQEKLKELQSIPK